MKPIVVQMIYLSDSMANRLLEKDLPEWNTVYHNGYALRRLWGFELGIALSEIAAFCLPPGEEKKGWKR